jgi:leucyl/phenylalanyl-tRNA---protein transferase
LHRYAQFEIGPDTFWIEPENRAILPLDCFAVSKSLAKTIRQDRFDVTADKAFAQVIATCAESRDDRRDTWINPDIEAAFNALYRLGHAHSIECWLDGELVGGLYGMAMGRAFFGESMFSRATDASKVALAWLVARMKIGDFELLDCQFMTDHLASLGAIEISQAEYLVKLEAAIGHEYQASVVSSPSPTSSAGAAGAGVWGALDGALAAGAVSPSAAAASSSSPGKLILQALTHTS